MYKTETKETFVAALKSVFGSNYKEDNRYENINIGIEYPLKKLEYPGLWVGFNERTLKTAGIIHREDIGGSNYRRWKFEGDLMITVLALTSYERDHISDLLVQMVAFGSDLADTRGFLQSIAENAYIGLAVNVDNMNPSGETASPGTPWGTEEIIYECSYRLSTIGDFAQDITTLGLISRIDVYPYTAEEGDQHTSGNWV